MLNTYLNYIQEASEPKVLYHASPDQNLKYLDPERTRFTHLKILKPYVYATDDKRYVSGFTFNKPEVSGFNYGRETGKPWTLEIPKKYMYVLNTKCSIYEVDTKRFKKLKTSTPEYVSTQRVKILKEEKYKSAKECMKKHGVRIKII